MNHTYSNEVNVWFTLNASPIDAAPFAPILLELKLRRGVTKSIKQSKQKQQSNTHFTHFTYFSWVKVWFPFNSSPIAIPSSSSRFFLIKLKGNDEKERERSRYWGILFSSHFNCVWSFIISTYSLTLSSLSSRDSGRDSDRSCAKRNKDISLDLSRNKATNWKRKIKTETKEKIRRNETKKATTRDNIKSYEANERRGPERREELSCELEKSKEKQIIFSWVMSELESKTQEDLDHLLKTFLISVIRPLNMTITSHWIIRHI